MKNKADSFDFFSLALDQSFDISDIAQLVLFTWDKKEFKITEELAAAHSVKPGRDLFTDVTTWLDRQSIGLQT